MLNWIYIPFRGTRGHSLTAITAKHLNQQFICRRDKAFTIKHVNCLIECHSDLRTRIDHSENEAQAVNYHLSICQWVPIYISIPDYWDVELNILPLTHISTQGVTSISDSVHVKTRSVLFFSRPIPLHSVFTVSTTIHLDSQVRI